MDGECQKIMSYKNIGSLMEHLIENGIQIEGPTQKRQLINVGYYHGYKGYRFFDTSNNRLPFKTFEELYATIQYDSKLKALLFEKIVFIETAVRNISLEEIMESADSENIQVVIDRVISNYNDAPSGSSRETKRKLQLNKLNLKKSVEIGIANAYQKNNPKITHFYNTKNNTEVPLWALFEIFTMGDLGRFLSFLKPDYRRKVSERVGINSATDTNDQLVFKYIYALKDLRNAIAHNAVVYDARFRKFDPNKAMKQCLVQEMGMPFINFKRIEDYVVLICYFLKILVVPKEEIATFVDSFEELTEEYEKSVNEDVSSISVSRNLRRKMMILKKYLKST